MITIDKPLVTHYNLLAHFKRAQADSMRRKVPMLTVCRKKGEGKGLLSSI
jgi:hypothetical protein